MRQSQQNISHVDKSMVNKQVNISQAITQAEVEAMKAAF